MCIASKAITGLLNSEYCLHRLLLQETEINPKYDDRQGLCCKYIYVYLDTDRITPNTDYL